MISVASNYVANVVALTGEYTEEVEKYSDVVISVPSSETTKIQEIHAIVGHILCECVEETLLREANENINNWWRRFYRVCCC